MSLEKTLSTWFKLRNMNQVHCANQVGFSVTTTLLSQLKHAKTNFITFISTSY